MKIKDVKVGETYLSRWYAVTGYDEPYPVSAEDAARLNAQYKFPFPWAVKACSLDEAWEISRCGCGPLRSM